MQHMQQREIPEYISWARALVFAVGFFFIAAILIGQLPGYVYLAMTAASLAGLEQGSLALAAACLGIFIIIQVIVMLFDPKPVVPPGIFTALGGIFALGGLALMLGSIFTNNQYFPHKSFTWNPLLGGNFLWFQPEAIDFAMIGGVILGIGAAMIFYGILAQREQHNPDRGDLGTTPMIRGMIIAGTVLLVLFMLFYTFVSDQGLAYMLMPTDPNTGQLIIDTIINGILGIAIFCTLGAFALRLHYLLRPVRKNTMPNLYMVGVNVAQVGAIFFLVWLLAYPAIAWIHSWTLIGLGDYLTICARKAAIPQSCSFSPQAGYIGDAVITTNFFALLMAAIWAWKSKRNLVVIGSVVVTAVLALATLLVHTHPDEILIAMLLCGGALILAAIWTSVSRREFAIVGENNLGCLGQWLVVGTCLLTYLAAFAFFSIPGFRETEPNIPFVPGNIIAAHPASGQPPTLGSTDAVVMVVLMGVLASVQFFFLVRNRYKM